jgi:hypothetical protein
MKFPVHTILEFFTYQKPKTGTFVGDGGAELARQADNFKVWIVNCYRYDWYAYCITILKLSHNYPKIFYDCPATAHDYPKTIL